MPSEYRQLRFSQHELVIALVRFNADRDLFDTSRFAGLNYHSDQGDLSVIIELSETDRDKATVVRFGTADLFAALIRFCIDSRISLPGWADKRLTFEGGDIYLHLRSEETISPSIDEFKILQEIESTRQKIFAQ